MRLAVRHKLVLLAALVLIGVASGYAWLSLHLSGRALEEDLKFRAVIFAREIAATIGDRDDLLNEVKLTQQITRLGVVRPSVLQLDVLALADGASRVVASSNPAVRLPFSRRDGAEVRSGRTVARLIETGPERYWEVIAPIALENDVGGAIAVKFSTQRGDELAARIRFWALTLGAASLVAMGLLMSVAIRLVVDRPIRRFMTAIARTGDGGEPTTVDVTTRDEFGTLARHFNEMVSRIARFNEELRARVREATDELHQRYRQVERLNTQLFQTQRRLGAAERLALSGQIMAEVAHEIGTPLHSVAGHLELLGQDLRSGARSDEVARRLEVIGSQVGRMTDIITRLLDLTRPVPAEPRAVDLPALVGDTVELMRPGLARAGVHLDVHAEPGLPGVRGQPEQLQQVVLNLLTNAIDAMPAGGRITIAARPAPGRAGVTLSIADSGSGIAADLRERIFEPFFSTKGPGRGTGLGLFISAAIVREHGGRIEVDSVEGQGSTFRIWLPAGAVPV
jgi:two-component system NtrC family sensor kinase